MYTRVAAGLLAIAPLAFAAPAPQAEQPNASASVASPSPPVNIASTVSQTHQPYSGVPTTTGALTTSVLAASIPALPPNPTATTYPSDGQLHDPMPAPYTPAGGLGTNGTEPVYNVKSDFDFESLVSCPSRRCKK